MLNATGTGIPIQFMRLPVRVQGLCGWERFEKTKVVIEGIFVTFGRRAQ